MIDSGESGVFGGRGLNDVWRSNDGAHWMMAFSHDPWSPRTTIHSVVFNDKLWIYGGKTGRKDRPKWGTSEPVWLKWSRVGRCFRVAGCDR